MLFAVIATLDDNSIQQLQSKPTRPVYARYERLDAAGARQVFAEMATINVDVIFADLDSTDGPALLESINKYRQQRPETRIIIYAPGRQPGDVMLSRLRGMGVHDILAPEDAPADMAEYITQSLESNQADYADSARWGISQQEPVDAQGKSMPGKTFLQGITINLSGRKRRDTPDVRYIAHQIIAVWSPTGYLLAFTALNLAALAAARGFDTALVNYDLACPDLDSWFGVKQTGVSNFEDASAGVVTFDINYRPEIVAQFMKKRDWGIQYLPAGNKLGRPGTPDLADDDLEQVLRIVSRRNIGNRPAVTIVDAGTRYEDTSAMAALRLASVVLVPTDGIPPMAEVVRQQVQELTLLQVGSRYVEACLGPIKRPAWALAERLHVQFDWQEYLDAACSRKPMALRKERRQDWEALLDKLS